MKRTILLFVAFIIFISASEAQSDYTIMEEKKSFASSKDFKVIDGKIQLIVNKNHRFLPMYAEGFVSIGDTVLIFGCSKDENYSSYEVALYSYKNVGIFFLNSEDQDLRNQLALLPNNSDSQVQKELEECKRKYKQQESRRESERINSMLHNHVTYYPILISNLSWLTNSSGGIELKFNITNCTQNTIKYVYITGYCLNAVKDRCRDEISGKTTWTIRCIGPIEPCPTSINNFYEREKSCVRSYHFDNPIFYSHVTKSIVFSSISIEYMNGKKTILNEEILKKHRIR